MKGVSRAPPRLVVIGVVEILRVPVEFVLDPSQLPVLNFEDFGDESIDVSATDLCPRHFQESLQVMKAESLRIQDGIAKLRVTAPQIDNCEVVSVERALNPVANHARHFAPAEMCDIVTDIPAALARHNSLFARSGAIDEVKQMGMGKQAERMATLRNSPKRLKVTRTESTSIHLHAQFRDHDGVAQKELEVSFLRAFVEKAKRALRLGFEGVPDRYGLELVGRHLRHNATTSLPFLLTQFPAAILHFVLVIPAIDLRDGSCVRLYQGDYDKSKEYETDPVAVAHRFEAAGATRLHVVDLDAARGSAGNNRNVIRRLLREVHVEFQVGGGVRSEEDIEALHDIGAEMLIVGTALVREPNRVRSWIERFGGGFIAGIDARDGNVSISGWEEDAGITDIDLAQDACSMGFDGIVYTNIRVDGTLTGPDLPRTNAIAEASGIDVILSGGIGTLGDVRAVCAGAHAGVIGMVIGKALYEDTLGLSDAIAAVTQ